MIWHSHLAECIEYLVKVDENFTLRNLGDVVHAFTRIVSNTGVLVAKAGENWGDDFFEIASDFLHLQSAHKLSSVRLQYIQVPMLSRLQPVL